ncbi:MAG: hypothetical protein HC821_02220 [Lewinella sp.]|nr:hypothetical protein [Lewinella sp.]
MQKLKNVFLSFWVSIILLVACQKPTTEPENETPFVFQPPTHFGTRFTIPADNPMSQAGVELGRMLFYEKRLSVDNTIACASCHQQKHAFPIIKHLAWV